MWGYIVYSKIYWIQFKVPSLYVRVYRKISTFQRIKTGSLIICEGISSCVCQFAIFGMFPHYMWGYIGIFYVYSISHSVPSLYVRVYRGAIPSRKSSRSSLIICEGISIGGEIYEKRKTFPHYMWGYIEYGFLTRSRNQVPSLYVRVYRLDRFLKIHHWCSLIICEGISMAEPGL